MKKVIFYATLGAFAFIGTGCSPEVGSEKWCKQMQEKPKADWTVKEVQDYSKYCIFKSK